MSAQRFDLVVLRADPARDTTAFSKVRYTILGGKVMYSEILEAPDSHCTKLGASLALPLSCGPRAGFHVDFLHVPGMDTAPYNRRKAR